MDSMLEENKNLKDTSKDSIKDTPSMSSPLVPSLWDNSAYHTKTNKLITALYMVTDTMEKEEPMRIKLRTLGIEILSDIISLPKGTLDNLDQKITTIVSFLNIASDIRMVSEMNCNILKKEFAELKKSIQEFTTQNHLWFEEFVSKSPLLDEEGVGGGNSKITTLPFGHSSSIRRRENSKGQGTRIGVQKGSTLMKALNKVGNENNGFEIIKKQRRESILKIIKACPSSGGNKPNGVSIKDIVFAIHNLGEETGEKTLQRELVSMVKDNVLKKTGEKRWSQYFLS
jgi:hypothetical protein